MKSGGRRVLAAAGATVLGATVFGSVAWGWAVMEIGATDNAYDSTNPIILEGTMLGFDNNGNNTHTVTADGTGPDGGALFDTGNVPGGTQNRHVRGTEFLDEGDYGFHCRIHPSQMQGTLQVDPSASGPVPRPRIEIKVKSKKLEKVVDSEKLKVEVTSENSTDAENVSLKAKKGKKKVAKDKLDVGGGKGDTAKLKLTNKGEKVLDDLNKAKVKVEGTVEFGFGDKAKKKLK